MAAPGHTGHMLTTMFKSRSTRREDDRMLHIETMKAKLSEFGDTHANPVKDEIASLRSLRDAGSLSDAAYAVKVSALLGALETRIEFPPITGRDLARVQPGK
jgi:hypothetical protein